MTEKKNKKDHVFKLRVNIGIENRKARAHDPSPSRYMYDYN